jgi:hypothetical protein
MRRPARIRRAAALIAFSVALLIVGTGAAEAVFTPGTLGTRSPIRSFGDINGDGLMDLGAYADSDPSEPSPVVVYRIQSAPGVFEPEVAVLERPQADEVGGNRPRVILADLTGDARLEELVALVGQGDRIAYMQPVETAARPAADRRWSVVPTDLGPGERSVDFFATGDVTGDGRVDAVLDVRGDGPKVLVAHRHGSAGPSSFEDWVTLPGDASDSAPDLLDVNRDGVLDIVVATGSGVGYLSARGGGLASWTALPGLGLSDVQAFAIGYFNADAAPDVALVRGPGDAPRFSLLVSGPTTYQERAVPVAPPGRPCDLDAGELNGDGKTDLVLLGCDDPAGEVPLDRRIVTLLGDGTGGFGQASVVPPSGRSDNGPIGVEIVDLDGDGLGEVVVSESDSATVIYMNRSVVVPPPRPLPPPPPRPPGCRPRADCTPPTAKVTVVGKRWSIRKPLVIRVRCNERCTATVSVQLLFARRTTVVRAIPIPRRWKLALRPPLSATVRLPLPRGRRRTAATLIGSGLRGSARVSVRAVDRSGNAKVTQKTIPLTL